MTELLLNSQKKKEDQQKLLKELLKRRKATESMANFVDYVMEMPPARHHMIWSRELDLVLTGKTKRLIISSAPGTAKSTYFSKSLPAKFMAVAEPGSKIVAASHTQELADEFGRATRNIVESALYRNVYSDVFLDQTNSAANRWGTTNGNTYNAFGVGGAIAGKRADLFLIDDPIKSRAEADSASRKKFILDWYKSDVIPRLKPQATIVIIATRWAEDDLIGHLLETEGHRWRFLRFQAICEDPATDPLQRKQGEPIWPEWQSLDNLLEIKESIGIRNWEALYQQNPTPIEGNMVRRDWFPTYSELPTGLKIFQSWDTAQTIEERSNYSVCATIGVDFSKNYYLIDLFREKLEFKDLQAQAVIQAQKHKPKAILVEYKGSGISLYQNLKGRYGLNLIKIKPPPDLRGGKIFRFEKVTPIFESGRFFVPVKAPWLDIVKEELVTFPGYKTDDIVDAIAQGLDWDSPQRGARGMGKLRG